LKVYEIFTCLHCENYERRGHHPVGILLAQIKEPGDVSLRSPVGIHGLSFLERVQQANDRESRKLER
jgi:hypothetical protein